MTIVYSVHSYSHLIPDEKLNCGSEKVVVTSVRGGMETS